MTKQIITGDDFKKMQSSITEQKDMLIIEAISRTLGHTDWTYDQVKPQMDIREYPDGSSLFKFQGRDMLLFDPPMVIDGKLCQPVQYLYDKLSFKYMTAEERFDAGILVPPKEELH